MNLTISFGPSINFSPGIIRVLTLQNFANSGVLSPDFETFIVAAETYVLFRLLTILWGQFQFHSMVRIVNCIKKCFVTTSFENNLLMAKGQTEFCLQQFLDSNLITTWRHEPQRSFSTLDLQRRTERKHGEQNKKILFHNRTSELFSTRVNSTIWLRFFIIR